MEMSLGWSFFSLQYSQQFKEKQWPEYADLFLCLIFTQRLGVDRKIERSDGRAFGPNLFDSRTESVSQEW